MVRDKEQSIQFALKKARPLIHGGDYRLTYLISLIKTMGGSQQGVGMMMGPGMMGGDMMIGPMHQGMMMGGYPG